MNISQQDAQNIVDEMKSSIHKDINIMNEDGIILASTNALRQGQLHQGAIRIIKEKLLSLLIEEDDPSCGVQRGVNLPIIIDGKLEGVIGITGDPSEVSIFGDVIKRMTEIMLESARQKEQLYLMERAKSLFMENWLFSDEPDWQELELRGRLLSLNINASYTVILLRVVQQAEIEMTKRTEDLSEMRDNVLLRTVQNHLLETPEHFCAVIRNQMIVLLHHMDKSELIATIKGICNEIKDFYHLQICAGISNDSKSASDIRRCYLEAKTAVAVAEQPGNESLLFYNQVSPEFIAQSIPLSIKSDLRKLVFAFCSEQERIEFRQTIELYYNQDGDIQKCADKLHIHRNTFQYRIDCIKKKTGYSLKVPKESLLLYLAIR